MDVGPETLEKLGVSRIEELENTGITHVRLDYGFHHRKRSALRKNFMWYLTLPPFTEEDIRAWKAARADFTLLYRLS